MKAISFVLLLIGHVLSAEHVISATYDERSSRLFGSDHKYAQIDVKFDQPVYLLDSFQCFSSQDSDFVCNDTISDSECPPCDYSDVENCGVPLWSTSNPNCTCPYTYSCADPIYTDVYYGWSTLNETGFQTTPDTSPFAPLSVHFWRFPVNESCQIINIEMNLQAGQWDLYAAWEPLTAATYATAPYRMLGVGSGSINICPTDPGYPIATGGRGTVFVYGFTLQSAQLSGLSTTKPYKPYTPDPVPSNVCNKVGTQNLPCLAENYTLTATASSDMSFYTYSVPATECSKVFVRISTFSKHQALLYVSSDASLVDDASISSNFYRSVNWRATMPNSDNILNFQYCPAGASGTVPLIIGVSAKPGVNFTLTVSTHSNMQLIDISTYKDGLPYEWTRKAVGKSKLVCGDREVTCYSDLTSGDCESYWPSQPMENPVAFWPVPVFVPYWVSAYLWLTDYIPYSPMEKNKFTAFAISNYNISVQRNFIDSFDNCRIEFTSELSLSNFTAIPSSVPLTKKQTKCDYEAFKVFYQNVTEINKYVGEASDSYTFGDYLFILETYYTQSIWSDCKREIESLFVQEKVTHEVIGTQCNLTRGSFEWTQDPCCNAGAQFTKNCLSRPVTISSNVITSPDSSKTQAQCASAECANPILNHYEQLSSFIDDHDTGCGKYFRPLHETTKWWYDFTTPYKACVDKVWGDQALMSYCMSDDQCAPTGVCNTLIGRCVAPINDKFDQFFDCFWDFQTVSSFLYLQSFFEIPYSDFSSPEFRAAARSGYDAEICMMDYQFNIETSFYSIWYPKDPECRDWCGGRNDYTCNVMLPEHYCDMEIYGACERTASLEGSFGTDSLYAHSLDGTCETLYMKCNWDDCEGLNSTECNATCLSKPNFCGYCVNADCYNVEEATTEAQCSATSICALANSTVLVNISASDCATHGVCSNSNFTDEASCNAGGYCMDADYFSQESFCLFPLLMDDTLNSYTCFRGSEVTPAGCADYSILDKSSCETYGNGAKWYTLAKTKNECLALEGCYEWYFYKKALTSKTPEVCAQNGGVMKPYWGWRQATWGPAKYVPYTAGGYNWKGSLSWQQTNYSSPYRLVNTTNMRRPLYWAFDSFTPDLVYKFRTYQLCSYDSLADITNGAVCDCASNSSNCPAIASSETQQVGTNQACAGYLTVINASPTVTIFNNDSLTFVANKSLGGHDSGNTNLTTGGFIVSSQQCVNIELSTKDADLYVAQQVFSFTSEALSSSDFNKYASIQNNEGELVGQLIGNGARAFMNFTATPATTLNYFILCISQSEDIKVIDTDEFPVYDFGTANEDNHIVPMDVVIVKNENTPSGMVCGRLDNVTYNRDTVYFPIIRRDNWKDFVQVNAYPIADQVICYIVGAVYVILGVAIAIQIIRIKPIKTMFLPRRVVLGLFLLLDIARALYEFITPSGKVYDENSAGAVVLSELPTFFFFSAFSILVAIWASIAHTNTRSATPASNNRRFRNICIAGNVLVYAVFIVLLILYSEVDSPTFNEEEVCGVTVKNSIPLHKQVSWRIVVAYKFFIFGIGLILGIIFAIYGYIVVKKVSGFMAKAKEYEKRLFLTTMVGSGAFLLHTVLVIITSFADQKATVAVLFVIIEGVPQCFIAYTYGVRAARTKKELEQSMVTVRVDDRTDHTQASSTDIGLSKTSSSKSDSAEESKGGEPDGELP